MTPFRNHTFRKSLHLGAPIDHNPLPRCSNRIDKLRKTLQSFQQAPSSMKPAFIITLVHGTFAPKADWITKEDAILRTALNQAFAGQITCRSFNWCGGNSHPRRLRAAKELADDQVKSHSDYPNTPHFIIAHSHGGNLALYSMADARHSPAGIITMGTPFFKCEPRDLAGSTKILRFGFAYLSLLLSIPLVLLLIFLGMWLGSHLPEGWRTTLGVIGGLYLVFLPIALACRFFQSFPKIAARMALHQEGIVTKLRLPPTTVPMLCFHVKRDEAGWWLRTTQKISDMPYHVWNRGTAVWLFAAFVMAGLWSTQQSWTKTISTEEASYVLFSTLLSAAIGVIMLGLYWQLLMLVFPRIIRSHGLAFGGEGFRDNWLVRIGTSLAPTEGSEWVTERPKEAPVKTKGLRHSWMYEDHDVAAEIVTWIRDRLGEAPKGNQST